MHFLLHALEWPYADPDGYNIFSGPLPMALGLGAFGAWWRKHNCHVHKCWRLQWHPHPEHGHVVCRKHHPNGKGVTHDTSG